MNEKKFYEDFKKMDWNFLIIEGSRIGNTSFLLSFIESILFGEDDINFEFINRLLGDQKSIFYLRTEPFKETDKKSQNVINSLMKLSTFETVFNEDAFEYRNLIRLLQNRTYTHLIIDDVRKEYEDNDKRFLKFSEVLSFCSSMNIKVITSVTENRLKKMDYQYGAADVILRVSHDIIQNLYFIDVENKKGAFLKKYSLSIK